MRVLTLGFCAGLAAPSAAMTPEEVQQCVWRCLANSSGAASSEYAQCVEAQCNEPSDAPATQATTDGRWRSEVLTPDQPPYLDGRAATVEARNGSLWFSYSCGRVDDSNLVLAGAMLDALSLTPEATYEALFVVDGRGTVKGFYEYEGALYSGIAPGDPLFAQLKRGSRLEIDLEGRTARFSLGGSSRALGEALDYCDQPVPAGVDLSWSDEGLEEGPELPVAGSEVPLNVAPQAPVAETPNVPAASSIRLSADREREVRAEAETGAPEHLNALGVALLSGRFGGVDRAGLDYINRAAAAGYPPALVNQFAMATFQNASMSEAFAGLMRAADAGDAVALTQVGVAYESGIGVADDEALALDYFEKGRAAGDFDAYAHLVNYYGDATTYERYQKEALAEGHRMMTFNRYLYNDHGDRAAALAALIAAAGRPPLNERYDQGLRYLPSLSADSDLNLLTNVIFARRSEYSPWTPEEFTQIMAPLKARYGCQDGRLYMETTNTLGCARP